MTNTVFFTTLRYTDQASDTSEIASNDENGTADDGSSGIDFGVPPQTIDNGGLVAKVALQSITKMICFSSLVSLDDQKEELLGVPTELAVDHTIDHQIQKQVQLHDTHRRHKPNSRLFINQVGSSNWPDWLLAVAGEAIEGWTPRQLHTFQVLAKVEKLQRVFKLFESSSEEHWKMLKLQEDSILKLQHPYDRCIEETLKDIPSSSLPLIETLLAIDPAKRQTATAALMSEFFRAKPYACKPSDLPYYPPTGNSVKLQAIAIKFVGRRRLLDSRENSNADGVSKTLAPDRFVNSIPVSQANKDFHNEFSGAKYCRDQPLVNPQINKSVQGDTKEIRARLS